MFTYYLLFLNSKKLLFSNLRTIYQICLCGTGLLQIRDMQYAKCMNQNIRTSLAENIIFQQILFSHSLWIIKIIFIKNKTFHRWREIFSLHLRVVHFEMFIVKTLRSLKERQKTTLLTRGEGTRLRKVYRKLSRCFQLKIFKRSWPITLSEVFTSSIVG